MTSCCYLSGAAGNSADADSCPAERHSDEFIVVRSAAARVGGCASNAETPAVSCSATFAAAFGRRQHGSGRALAMLKRRPFIEKACLATFAPPLFGLRQHG